jgi:hypothetical protein
MDVNIMEDSSKLTNKNNLQKHNPIHQLQENQGVNWIVIENGIVHDATNSYFEQIRQSNGDIYLRLVDIYSSKNRSSRPEAAQQPDDQDYGE